MPVVCEQNSFLKFETKGERLACLLIAAFATVVVALLHFQGRVWWCPAGDYNLWSWDTWSTHNSQHIVDPYSFTHILHGILEYWILGLLFPRMPLVSRLVIALGVESSWEVAENSSYVIQRYREETISLNYFGDSIINSISDIICCGLGFALASKLRFWKSLVLFIASEVVLIFWIHDSLLINILMLVWPIEAIKHWQMGT